ncbi:MAG TPA: hypothetical protein VIK55_14105 [Paludibacter sp.]
MSEKKIELKIPTIEVSNYGTKYLKLTITDNKTTVNVFIDPNEIEGLTKKIQSTTLEMKVLEAKESSIANY